LANEKKIRRHLEEADSELYDRFRQAERELGKLLEYSQGGGHLSYTPHGPSHVAGVERNYDWLLGEEDILNLNASECYCLLVATQVHDILMIPREIGLEREARQKHATAPLEYLTEHGSRLGVNPHEAYAISEIVRAHHVDHISDVEERTVLGGTVVELRKLGACLSVADICHASSDRAPQIVFEYLNLDPESTKHWRRHLQIGGITRPPGSTELLMSAFHFTEEGEAAVREYAEEIDRQLERVAPYFRNELPPITGVELDLRRLNSPVDRDLRFQTDMSAILRILIDGVYERSDVFVRELVQNALDATYIRQAQAVRRGEPYEPRVTITEYEDDEGCRGIRVDDNGAGMDFTQVQDMLLLIGGTSTDSSSVRELLGQTTRKNLIATFGVGLLSCLKVASRIVIETAKAGATPVRLELRGIDERIVSSEAAEQEPGTSIFVELSTDYHDRIDIGESSDHYLRLVDQADVRTLRLPWDQNTVGMPRGALMAAAATEGTEVHEEAIGALARTEVGGADYRGWIWFPDVSKTESAPKATGEITVLNDGIYVSTDPTDEWLPRAFHTCNGILNFSAKSIDLPVSRDRVMQNEALQVRRRELAARSRRAIAQLSNLSANPFSVESAALLTMAIFRDASEEERGELVRELDRYTVKVAGRRPMSLADLAKLAASTGKLAYVGYPQGNLVGKLTEFDGKQLFHKEDDIVSLQSSWLSQQGETVIEARRPANSEDDLIEISVIVPYLLANGINVIDLNRERPIQGQERSKPLPRESRNLVGANIKFVEFPGLVSKRAWRIGRESWLNLAHPDIARSYEVLSAESDSPAARAAATLVKLAALDFEGVRRDLVGELPKGET
jgi:hypothetical protein